MSLSAKFPHIPRFACILAAGAALSFAQFASAGDVHTISIAGFNNASGVGYILGSAIGTVSGQTTTYAGAGYNGQA